MAVGSISVGIGSGGETPPPPPPPPTTPPPSLDLNSMLPLFMMMAMVAPISSLFEEESTGQSTS